MKEFLECHEEEIHVPGHVQSFGYLIGLDQATRKIKFYSENILQLFSSQVDLFGKKPEDLADVFTSFTETELYRNIEKYTRKEADFYSEKITVGVVPHHFQVYKFGETLFLEFEKFIQQEGLKANISNHFEKVSGFSGPNEIWEKLVASVFEVTGYDRIMVYRFLEDGTGKVIAERTNPGLESYLNLHYPESDIPRQARALYLKKRKRIFSDVNAEPVPIFSRSDEKIDLTYSSVRAMSPVHGQYLKNTGVESSFSTSIIIDNKLWGLVTCQNVKAKHIDLLHRIRAEVFTALSANSYMSFKAQQRIKDIDEFNSKTHILREKLIVQDNLKDSLFENIEILKEIVESDGMAILTDGEIKTCGAVPPDEAIAKIVEWYLDSGERTYYSNSFLKDFGNTLGIGQNAAGIFIAQLEESGKQILIWFRKEYREHINWAGYNEKKAEPRDHYGIEKIMISPRKSFEIFSQDTKGKSRMWKQKSILAVERLIPVILQTSLKHSNKVMTLNEELKIVNEELDSFAYSISHDLGTPLTVMMLNAQMLEKSQRDNPEVRDKLKKILNEIEDMKIMLRNVLNLSRAKSADIVIEGFSPKKLIEKISYDVKLAVGNENSEIIIGDTPEILADRTMIIQVFQNVIGNAVKYSSKVENPKVEISGEISGNIVTYKIMDNGIGIAESDHENMFKVFSRMQNAKTFQGSGVGLSIVHRIMKRLGGSVSYVSRENEGTVFYLTFKKP